MKILLTGAGGMLGGYIKDEFSTENIKTLGISENSDFKTDLIKETPSLGENEFDLVIHTAGTENNSKANALNLEGTKRLLEGLQSRPPRYFVYISSYKVYSRDAGENLTEESHTWASDETGRSKALAEQLLKDWCEKHDVVLSIVRPARMFGNGVKGDTLTLFNDALSGKYIHIRGNDAKVSIVCALDVAKSIKEIYTFGGIYNASDNRPVKFIDLVEAMTANAGSKKRMTHLPISWAEWIWRYGRWIPFIDRNLSPQVVEDRMKSLTLDGTKLIEAAGFPFHDTIAVIERTAKDYPYSEIKKKVITHEV